MPWLAKDHDEWMYRDLTDKEIISFKQWARDNYKPGDEIKTVWHPVVKEECVKINEEHEINN